MNPSFTLVILTLSLTLTQICSAAKPKQNSNSSPDSKLESQSSTAPSEDYEIWDEEEFFNPNEKKPSMSCLLFGVLGCSRECRVKSLLYDIKATGSCDQLRTCRCQYENISLEREWEKKFNADYVHEAIIENKEVLEQVQKLLENPLRTAEQFRRVLKPIITPFQYTKLKINDHTLAAQFTKENGDPDTEAVQKYVSEQVENWLKWPSVLKSLQNTKYSAKLLTALKNAKRNTLFNIAYRLDQMKNPILNNIFEEYLKQGNIDRPKIQMEKQDLNEVFNATFVNEIIKRIDDTNSSSKTVAKKSPARSKSAKKSS